MYVVSRASFGAIPPVTLGALRVIVGGLTLTLAVRLVARRGRQTAMSAPSAGQTGMSAPPLGGQTFAPQVGQTFVSVSAGEPWQRADHLRAFVCGVLVAGCILAQFLGTSLASAHDGALLTTVTPVFIVPLAWLLLGERPTWRIALGMLLALAGVAIVVASQDVGAHADSSLLGDGLLLLSALFWALFTVVGAPLVRRFSALAASTAATLWCIPLLVPLAAVELALRPQNAPPLALTPGSVAAVLYLGWGATALAWWLWYRGVAKLAAGVAAVFFFAQPVVGGLLSGLLLHEPLPPGFWLGGGVLAVGILFVSWQKGGSSAPAD
jgi:drug/metabolite transporter (DMT)-like permease